MTTPELKIVDHPFENNNPLSFLTIDVMQSYQQHAHPFYEIIYVSEGKGLLFIDKESLEVSEGDLFFIPIGIHHMFYRQDNKQPAQLQIMNCMFLPEVLMTSDTQENLAWDEEFQEIAGFFRRTERWLGYREQNNEFARIMYSMHLNQMNATPGYRYKLYLSLLELLHTMHMHSQFSYPAAPMKIEDPVTFTTNYVQTHYRDPLKLEELCQWISISPRHLQRKLKQATGQTFIQLLQNVRVMQSCELLIETDWSVQMIAAEVGVHDMKYFYRIFKTRCGLTPSQFRKQHTGSTVEPGVRLHIEGNLQPETKQQP